MCSFWVYFISDADDPVEDDCTMAALDVVEAICGTVKASTGDKGIFGEVPEGASVRESGIAHTIEIHGAKEEKQPAMELGGSRLWRYKGGKTLAFC